MAGTSSGPVTPQEAAEASAASLEPANWGPTLCLIAGTAVAGLIGTPLGLVLGWWTATGQMATMPWVGLAQAHGQVQLFGWIGLSILGVTLHAMAHLFRSAEPAARVGIAVLVLQLLGVGLRVAAPLAPLASAWLLIGSALALLGAYLTTLVAHVETLPSRRGASRAPSALPRYLLVGLLLWLVALLANLDGAIAALRGTPLAAGTLEPVRDAFIVAAVSGGMAMVATGMSLRVVVGWTDLPAPDLRRAAQAWWPLTGAVVLRAAVPGIQALSADAVKAAAILGALLWAAGVAWYLLVLRGLWAPETVRMGGGEAGEADPPLAWFVRTAYVWLAVSGLLALAQPALAAGDFFGLSAAAVGGLVDAERHALMLGFLATLTAGLAGRLPTAFLDVGDTLIARTHSSYRAVWALLLTAAVLRVGAPLLHRPWLVAISGATGAVALLLLLSIQVRIARAAWRRASRITCGSMSE